MHIRVLFPLFTLLASTLTWCQAPNTAKSEPFAADTNQTTPAGATFTAPTGWTVSSSESAITLQPPEPDTHIVITDLSAPDADTAVAQAWKRYKPDFQRPLKTSVPVPDRQGWSDGKQFVYETSPNERAVVIAIARRAAGKWSVMLVDASVPTLEKRGSQLNLIAASLRPKEFARETFAGRTALHLTPERIEQIRSFLEASIKKFGVPGAGIAFLDNGKLVYEGGIGVKELGKPEPVDANTLFMAASNTKGMTTLLMAKLVDAKKLKWDQPVTQIYPDFKLADASVTREVEVKHLICACTGMPRQDMEWIFGYKKYKPASTFTLLSDMKPTSKFGEVFQYSNIMASAAGYIAAHLYEPQSELGAAYDRAMEKQIFDPLGMTHTTFDMAKAQRGNYAKPHSDDIDGHPTVIAMEQNYSVVPFRPAGGVWTSAHDLSQYVMLEMHRGKLPNGEQFISEENLLMRRKPQIATGEDQAYGMGLMTDNHWGIPIVHHGGSLFGYKSDWVILPDAGIGAILLTNADNGGMLLGPLMRRLVEIVYDGKPEAANTVDTAASNFKTVREKERARLTLPAGPEADKLAPHYVNEALGNLKTRKSGTKTIFTWDGGEAEVATRKNDDKTISFITADPPLIGLEFVNADRQGKRALLFRDAQHEYVFLEAK